VSFAYHLTVTVHVLAAMLWLGGMIFFAVVGAPVLRGIEDERFRAELFEALGVAFRRVGWSCIVILVVTGIGQLHFRGWWGMDVWRSETFRHSPAVRAFMWKMIAVAVMIVISSVHDFVLGPKAGRLPAGSAEARKVRGHAAWLARLNALVGVVLVYLAVRVARGG